MSVTELFEEAKKSESLHKWADAKEKYLKCISLAQEKPKKDKELELVLADAFVGLANSLRLLGSLSNWRKASKRCKEAKIIYKKHKNQKIAIARADIIAGLSLWKLGNLSNIIEAAKELSEGITNYRGKGESGNDWLFLEALLTQARLSLRISQSENLETALKSAREALEWLSGKESARNYPFAYKEAIQLRTHYNLYFGALEDFESALMFLDEQMKEKGSDPIIKTILILEMFHVWMKRGLGIVKAATSNRESHRDQLGKFLEAVEKPFSEIDESTIKTHLKRRMDVLKFGWMRLGGEFDESLVEDVMIAEYPETLSEEEILIYKSQAAKDCGWIFLRSDYSPSREARQIQSTYYFQEAVNGLFEVQQILTPLEKLSWAEAELGLAICQVELGDPSTEIKNLIENRLNLAKTFCELMHPRNRMAISLRNEIDELKY